MDLKVDDVSKIQDIRFHNLINTNNVEKGISESTKLIIGKYIQTLFGTVSAKEKHPPLPNPVVFHPYNFSKKYGITHFGIMIPDLPAPHYFLACASMLGACGFKVFDIDHAFTKHGPRYTATLAHGTANSTINGFKSYSMIDDMVIEEDGSLIKFGKDLELSGSYPKFNLKSSRENLKVDLELEATGEITWFCKSKVYNHLSLLTRYKGVIESEGVTSSVEGLCTYEYARAVSPYTLTNISLPKNKKIPINFFSYQVLNLDDSQQLLFAMVSFMGAPTFVAAYLRTAGKNDAKRIDGEVNFQVLSLKKQPAIAPDGSITPVPEEFRWTIKDKFGALLWEINGNIDTPMVFGLGNGFIGGYKWSGTEKNKAIQGRGYIEYVDQRQ